MRTTSAAPSTFRAAAAFFLITGLAGAATLASTAPHSQPRLAVDSPQARLNPGKVGPVLYVANYDNGQGVAVVQIFSLATHKQVGQINGFGFPVAMTVDGAGNLYVVDDAASNAVVYVFPPGATSPSRTISEAGYQPSGITVSHDGSIYVANFCQTDGVSCLGDGYTVKYPPVGSPAFYDVLGGPALAAVSSSNQLVIKGFDHAPVGDFPHVHLRAVASDSKNGFTLIRIPGAKDAGLPHMQFDSRDRLAFMAGRFLSFLEVLKPPSFRVVETIPFQGLAWDFAFPAGGRNVWAGLYVNNHGTAATVAAEFTYPGGKPVTSFPVGGAYGKNTAVLALAVSPALAH
jgi:DNA-binding beta-propeller fold protein YncE